MAISLPSRTLLERLAAARGIPYSAQPRAQSRSFLASDGVRLHYLDWSGGAETLILLHGGLLSAHTFDLCLMAMAPDIRCIALDLRGHGESGWAETYPIPRSAADVVELVDHLGLGRVHLAGMSLGGCVAGHAAPHLGPRLAGLIFIDVGAEVNFNATARMRGFIERVRPVAAIEDVVRSALAVSPETDPDLMLYRYQALLKAGPEGYVWKADRRRPIDFAHILGKMSELKALAGDVRCPVLVAKGGRSRVLSEATAARFAAPFPDGRWMVIPEAGHNVQEDTPIALAAAVCDLIQSHR